MTFAHCSSCYIFYALSQNWAGSNQLEDSLSSFHQLDSQHLEEEYEDADNNDDEEGFALDPFLENGWLRREPTTATKSQSPSNVAVPTLRSAAVPTLRPAAVPTLRPAAVAFSSRPPRLRFAAEARWSKNRLFNDFIKQFLGFPTWNLRDV